MYKNIIYEFPPVSFSPIQHILQKFASIKKRKKISKIFFLLLYFIKIIEQKLLKIAENKDNN